MVDVDNIILEILNSIGKKIHFIGVGGSGMFPLAQILQSRGLVISGSDVNESYIIKLERELGMKIKMGHQPENIVGADLIVYSAAIMDDNVELMAAKKSAIPVIERSQLLGIVTSWKENCVGVCGTHGKTTTTGMITQILIDANKDPSAIIGGKLFSINGNARVGKSDIMVCEACEYVDTFLNIYPKIAVILNIDEDHMEYFKTIKNVIKSYHNFCQNTSGVIIVNGDDEKAMKAIKGIKNRVITFGKNKDNDFYPENISFNGCDNNTFDVMFRGEKITNITINIPGEHNVINAIASFIVCRELGCRVDEISENIKSFRGVGRRFEIVGKYNGAIIADDYAHHPAEIEVTLKTAKSLGANRVWAIFQPFTFSRTYILLDEFIRALSLADKVILAPIMGSREINTYNIYSEDLAKKIPGAVVIETFNLIAEHIKQNVKEGDIVLTLGCGDIYKCIDKILS